MRQKPLQLTPVVFVTRAVEPELKFQALTPGIWIFGLQLQYLKHLKAFSSRSRMIWSIEN